MSATARLRSRFADDDLPPIATDDELLAWSRSLIAPRSPVAATARTAPRTAAAAGVPVEVGCELRLSDDELFAEIYERARAIGSSTVGAEGLEPPTSGL